MATSENHRSETGEGRRRGGVGRWAALAAVFGVLGLVGTAGVKSLGDLRSARTAKQALRAKIEAARLEIRDLETRIARLDNDPATLERLAREQLGMVRTGDVVIVLPADDEQPAH